MDSYFWLGAEGEPVPRQQWRAEYDYSGGKGAWFMFDGPPADLFGIFARISRDFDLYNIMLRRWDKSHPSKEASNGQAQG